MDQSSLSDIIHPITYTIIKNDITKHLIMPIGATNKISDQKFLSKQGMDITNMDRDVLFFSDGYFFTVFFNANTFEEKIKLIEKTMKSDYDKQTIGYLLQRMVNTIEISNDKIIETLIKLYTEYYKKYDNKVMLYSELYEEIKNILKNK